jgi:anaerobic C4-dicarboxylate transporter DcuA
MLMIAAVISAAASMQAAGGLDYMVRLAERVLRRNPAHVTLLSPLVTYLFTFVAGTGHVAYAVLPVIAEVAADTKIRPERPLGIAVIASQQAITASPISAATVALLGMLAGFDITLFDILKITVPATLIGVVVGALCSMRVGKELMDDPEYQRRVREGLLGQERVQLSEWRIRARHGCRWHCFCWLRCSSYSLARCRLGARSFRGRRWTCLRSSR